MVVPATIDDVEVGGRRVLVRVDFNCPLQDGHIVDDRRIRAALPTLEALRSRGARLILATHLGRPHGAVVDGLRVAPLAQRLQELLGVPVPVADDVAGESAAGLAEGLADGDVMMLENLRFEPGEEADDDRLARRLAGLAEVYVNDAFGTAHRAHASTEGVAHHLPAVAGYLMARELEALGSVIDAPRRPLLAILAGAKISSKIGVLRTLLPRVDALWVGGAMACTFYRARGAATGRSLVEEDQVAVARFLLDVPGAATRLHLPVDVVVASRVEAGAPSKVVAWNAIGAEDAVVDIGPETVRRLSAACASAGTVVWNGPLGVYEIDEFAAGTRAVAHAVAASDAVSVIGGGDLGAALAAVGEEARISHISTGGGATLEYLEGRELPGVAVLRRRPVAPGSAG